MDVAETIPMEVGQELTSKIGGVEKRVEILKAIASLFAQLPDTCAIPDHGSADHNEFCLKLCALGELSRHVMDASDEVLDVISKLRAAAPETPETRS